MQTNEPQNHQENKTETKGVMFEPYVVALIDFLGQAEQLAKWDAVPTSDAEKDLFVEAARGSFGRILKWRRAFENQFNHWLKAFKPAGSVALAAPDGGDELRNFMKTSIEIAHFSDTIVVFSPLQNEHDFPKVDGVYAFFVTCGALMLQALSEGTPFRGAIEIGMAGRFPGGDLYGPALASAHHLESKVAQYPRIVVGPKLVEYLHQETKPPLDSPATRANKRGAELCSALLASDKRDGCCFIDHLGDEFAKLGDPRDGWKEFSDPAHAFVKKERDRFKGENNSKLEERYDRLLEYFCSRRVQGQ